eukprot:CAMPEP_0180810194 /NCGR_PEP_ID=MMETSP1038_2-20121128/64750_1 /TAXON_ID=632150 /ORGANISM="Azadinium spinosum, Strain 3D9" /LENGTH=59 /DNA_ID=CAMNT_0022851459 /DNA_START=325 /DNA_END=504 /DNA_ORIENTATION=-
MPEEPYMGLPITCRLNTEMSVNMRGNPKKSSGGELFVPDTYAMASELSGSRPPVNASKA